MPTGRPRGSGRSALKPAPIDVSEFRPHPWHGLPVGPEPPDVLNVFVEITPFDLMKYEVDKASGYLRIDRPQRSSSQPPSLYGFVPRTYCAERVRRLAPDATAIRSTFGCSPNGPSTGRRSWSGPGSSVGCR